MFRRMLVANRGEIAMRIIRCCSELGIETVLVHSEEDADSLPAQFATKAVCIGPAPSSKSYLNQDSILKTAKEYHCDALHPGYGFLSENADFAQKCKENHLEFVGPSAQIIRNMGDKQSARRQMRESGVPVVPGSDGLVSDAAHAAEIAEQVGYPVLMKASAGGGGRGMRIAASSQDIASAFEEAKAEAMTAFGCGDMYLEKLIEHPRHIEFQILGDKFGNIIHLGERDCSMQRRNQKLIEESPARCLTPELRKEMGEAALLAARTAGYYSAGTVEFVLDREGHYYFIEMNTRIQVEHPVTEMVTGVDLVKEQIRVAAGLHLSWRQEEIQPKGHAIECRINAENPAKGFQPSPGNVTFLHMPGGCGIRVETALYNGCSISPWYDSMAAKIIVHAGGRLEAIRRMRMALEETILAGVETNVEFLILLMFHTDYMMNRIDTSFLEKHTEEILELDRESRKI